MVRSGAVDASGLVAGVLASFATGVAVVVGLGRLVAGVLAAVAAGIPIVSVLGGSVAVDVVVADVWLVGHGGTLPTCDPAQT